MVFAIHWHKSAMDLHVFPILIPPPTSLSIPFLWVFPVHQPWALVSVFWNSILAKELPLVSPVTPVFSGKVHDFERFFLPILILNEWSYKLIPSHLQSSLAVFLEESSNPWPSQNSIQSSGTSWVQNPHPPDLQTSLCWPPGFIGGKPVLMSLQLQGPEDACPHQTRRGLQFNTEFTPSAAWWGFPVIK